MKSNMAPWLCLFFLLPTPLGQSQPETEKAHIDIPLPKNGQCPAGFTHVVDRWGNRCDKELRAGDVVNTDFRADGTCPEDFTHVSMVGHGRADVCWKPFDSPQTPSGQHEKNQTPLTEGQIIELLQGGVPLQRVEFLAHERGILFQITPAIERDLRNVGVTDDLLRTLRELAAKPAQIAVQTSPRAQVYLDGVPKGFANPQGRLVIENVKPGIPHKLRVFLPGVLEMHDHEQQIILSGGQVANVKVTFKPTFPGAF